MNVRHSMGVLHSFSMKNFFYGLKVLLFSCDDIPAIVTL